MTHKLLALGTGLLMAGLAAPHALAQGDYLSPQLNFERNFGYQQPPDRAANPSGGTAYSPGRTSYPSGRTGYSPGGVGQYDASPQRGYLSGGTSYYSTNNPYGGAQQFTIYNPMAVAGMPGVSGRGEINTEWPPRGGPWGMGQPPAPATPATDDSTLTSGRQPQVDMPATPLDGQPPSPFARRGAAPPETPGEGGEPAAEPGANPAGTSTEWLDRYRPELPTTTLYDQYRSRVQRSLTGEDEEGGPDGKDSATPRTPYDSNPLASVYSRRLREASRRGGREESLSAPDKAEKDRSERPSMMRYLSPIYHRPDLGQGDQPEGDAAQR